MPHHYLKKHKCTAMEIRCECKLLRYGLIKFGRRMQLYSTNLRMKYGSRCIEKSFDAKPTTPLKSNLFEYLTISNTLRDPLPKVCQTRQQVSEELIIWHGVTSGE